MEQEKRNVVWWFRRTSAGPTASEAESVLLELTQDRGRAGLQIFGQLSNGAAVLHGLEEDLALTRIACRGQVGVMKTYVAVRGLKLEIGK